MKKNLEIAIIILYVVGNVAIVKVGKGQRANIVYIIQIRLRKRKKQLLLIDTSIEEELCKKLNVRVNSCDAQNL